MRRIRAVLIASTLLTTALAALALVTLGPRRGDLPAHLSAPNSWADWARGHRADELVATLAGITAYAVLAWLGVGVMAVLASRLPGAVGRSAVRLSAAMTPQVLRQVVATAVGASLGLGVSAPAYAGEAEPADLDWPSAAATSAPEGAAGGEPAESPVDQPLSPAPARPGGAQPSSREVVTVRPGDCLWTIAARHLSGRPTAGQIAVAWPRWYTANRDVIGSDPDLLRPGQRLASPD